MDIFFIRHGMTPGNACHRYVGRTDEGLSEEGRKMLADLKKQGLYRNIENPVARIYTSPMKRCRETAAFLFPDVKQYAIKDLQECNFGDFEYKNYQELNGNADYQAWIDSGGRLGFPGGETQDQFCSRVVSAFESFMDRILEGHAQGDEQMVMVVHGGTIMAILDAFSHPHRDYFEWQAANGYGYQVHLDTEQWRAGAHFLTAISAL